MRCIWCARRCSSPATRSSFRIRPGRRAQATSSRRAPGRSAARCTRRLDWRFDLDELESRITPATRAIYINSPHNPTGGVLTRADLERIAAIVRDRNLWLISDEAYEDVVFDGAQHVSPASLPDMYERTISVYTFSKTYAMTGLRLGYLATTDAALRERIKKVLFYTCSNVTSIVQFGGIGALEGSQEHRRAVPRRSCRPGATCSMRASARMPAGCSPARRRAARSTRS